MMYSVYSKKELAHDEGIWSCAWGRYTPEKKKKDQENNADENDEKSRDSVSSEDAPVDFLITGAMDDLVKVWDLNQDKLELKHTLEGHSLGILSVAVSNNGKLCASSSLDSSLRIWDLEKGEQISSMDVGPMDLWTVAFSPDDKFIIFGNQSGEISQYNIAENMKTEQTFETRGKFILSLAYSPDGKYIASGAIDGIINIFDVVSNKLMHTLEGHAMPIRSLCFSPNSQFLLTGSDDGHMKLYDVQDTHVIGTMSGHASWVLEVDFSPDGMNFVSSSSDKTVKVWEVQSRQCVHTFNEHADQVWGVKYSPDNNKIMSVSEDKNLIIYSCPKL